jgi:hypothetical protein
MIANVARFCDDLECEVDETDDILPQVLG